MRPWIQTAPLPFLYSPHCCFNYFRQTRISVPGIIHSKKTTVILPALEFEMRAALSGVSIKTEKIVEVAARDWIGCHEHGKA